jgi:hypothetical protein
MSSLRIPDFKSGSIKTTVSHAILCHPSLNLEPFILEPRSMTAATGEAENPPRWILDPGWVASRKTSSRMRLLNAEWAAPRHSSLKQR